ncbi:MAG: FAD-binding protein [Bacteroidia bacterium]|nr:FAD-binding protein [Bacteroidia bacterium]
MANQVKPITFDQDLAGFFNETIYQPDLEIKKAIASGSLPWEKLPDFEQVAELENPGYQPVENGYCQKSDGSIKIAVLTPMPGVEPEMWDWWFGWHGSQDQRYRLWHPGAHVSARWSDGKTDSCYIGRTSIIREYIGEELSDAAIQFKSPLDFGFSKASISEKNKQVFICARLGLVDAPIDFGYLVHQIRQTENGSEMRSRFWIGAAYLGLRNGGKIPELAKFIGSKLKPLPKNFAQNLLLHCGEEMGHLAGFLPELYQTHQTESLALAGKVTQAGEPGFDTLVKSTLFNKWDHGIRPSMVIEPQTIEDVIAVLKYAKGVGKKVSISSGGHSFSANFIRDNGILLLMKNFNQFEVNKEAMLAKAGPGVGGSVLLKALVNQNLFFPAGHCKGVCIGGYLLQGGYGWNGRKMGIACQHIAAMDIVTASGELVHASEKENADLFWAARGSGPGFFGVVVAFYLKLFPLPAYRGVMIQNFRMAHLEEVYRWAHEVGPSIPKAVEFQILMNRNMNGFLGPGMEAFAPIFADSRDEFEEAQRFMKESPIRKKALFSLPTFNPGMELFYRAVMSHYPEDHHWGVDNMWTHAGIEELLPHIKNIAHHLPASPSHFLWLNWQADQIPTNMAHSKEDKLYLALYSCWKNPEDTAKYGKWAFETMKSMEHLSTGIQLADEGLHKRTFSFMSDHHLEQVQRIREKWDPNSLFYEWHSKPKVKRMQEVLEPA